MAGLLNFKANIFAFLILFIILIHQNKGAVKTKGTKLFCCLCVSVGFELIIDGLGYLFDGKPQHYFFYINHAINFIYYIVSILNSVIWCLYIQYSIQNSFWFISKHKIFFSAPAIIGFFFIFLSPHLHLIYYIDQSNFYRRGPLFILAHLPYLFYMLFSFLNCFIATIKEKEKEKHHLYISLSAIMLFPIIATVIQFYIYISALVWLSYALAVIILFFLLQTTKENALQLQMEHMKYELLEKDVSVMRSQIQPHFLFNALNTISYLCGEDAEKAQTAVQNFSEYLRTNLDSLSNQNPVSFMRELDHVKNYMGIELLRFPKIRILYMPEFTAFELPPLTLQPLVENSVKHGLYGKENGGLIILKSTTDGKNAIITISDDGEGFDPKKPLDTSRTHIGLKNVEKRLYYMCKGSMTIDSAIGKGTKITLTLPLQSQKSDI